MAKRFIETNIWDKKSIRELSPKLKLAWFYLVSRCNHAGIWECDIDLMSFQIGEEYTVDELLESFKGNMIYLGDDKYYLTKFINYQYGLPLNPKVKVHQSVMKILKKYNIDIESKEDIAMVSFEKRKTEFIKRVQEDTKGLKGLKDRHIDEFIHHWTEFDVDSQIMKWEFKRHEPFNPRMRMESWIKNDYQKPRTPLTFQPVQVCDEKLIEDMSKQKNYFKEADEKACDDDEKRDALGLK